MKLFSKILLGIGISLVMLIGYYLFPISNKNNIADPALRSKFIEDSRTYKHWQEFYDLLNEGQCTKAVLKYLKSPNHHDNIYWFSRMLRYGVCVPKDPLWAYALVLDEANQHYYFPDLLLLGYMTEMGIGPEADPDFALEVYQIHFSRTEKLDENHYNWITSEFRYIFDGQAGTPLLRLAFEETLAKR